MPESQKYLSKYEMNSTYAYFKEKVPFIEKDPDPLDYDLAEDWEAKLGEETRRAKISYRLIYWSGLALVWIIVMFILDDGNLTENQFKDTSWMTFFNLLWIYPLFLLLTGIEEKIKKRFIRTPIKTNVDRYHNDKKAYLYWWYHRQNDYWSNLNGYEFEESVGQIYARHDYKVHQTKLSGDGGIDLILEKNKERIAVQCKAHKKAVGPSVVRDLYGTMNHFGYKKGILVSLNGFTKGVYTFVQGKNIELVSLHDLILMSNG